MHFDPEGTPIRPENGARGAGAFIGILKTVCVPIYSFAKRKKTYGKQSFWLESVAFSCKRTQNGSLDSSPEPGGAKK